MIVATASLEVGFNDPEVNVVLQHKSPRDPAQFLQRKGRAGRRTKMRPWTVVVLSDYGRDRFTWQSYDLLFDPQLQPRDLPVGNRYVLRMQAVFAFMDWIAEKLRKQRGIPHGRVWQDFASPPANVSYSNQSSVRTRQEAAATIIDDLLSRDDRQEELSQYLQRSLAQDESVIAAVMWESPRALMTAVLPTLLRRLKSGWKRSGKEGELGRNSFDHFVVNNPLPEFIPGQLFSDLNLPEVSIVTPAQQQNDQPREETLPIQQAMKEFAPGRVSRRFGILNQWARHWIALPDLIATPVKYLPLARYLARFDELGEFNYWCPETRRMKVVRCVRPFELHPQLPPEQVQDTSNAFLTWHTEIVPGSEGISVGVPSPSRWETVIREIEFFTHCHHAPLEIRRFSMSSEATVKMKNGKEIETRVKFVDPMSGTDGNDSISPNPVAVGFAADVDGVVFRFIVPDDCGVCRSDAALVRGLRTAMFRDRVIADTALDGIANKFRRHWLADVYIAAITESACASGSALSDIWRAKTECAFDDVLQIIFQSIPVSSDGGHTGDEPSEDAPLDEVHQKLYVDLSALLNDAIVVNVLRRHAPTLWQDPDASWSEWLERKFKTTLGAAILSAIQQLCPDIDSGDLTLDIDSGPHREESVATGVDLSEVWLTERTVGGGGIIESFLMRYGEDPRRFFDLVEAALTPSDFEIADEQLSLFLDWAVSESDTAVRDAVALVRKAFNDRQDAVVAAFQELYRLLSGRGLFTCHSVIAAISTRILKPGSSTKTDQMLHQLIHTWKAREAQLGIEIDSRVFASQCARDGEFDNSLGEMEGDSLEIDRRQWRFNALMSVLWPRGAVIRSRRISVYNPFTELPSTEPGLIRSCVISDVEVVDVAVSGWREKADEVLVRNSSVRLRVSANESRRLRSAIITMIVDPIDSGFMLVHPRVRSMERGAGFISITLDLAEAVQ
ncbi:MAG: protein DpdJ [Planctomycetaceae bacterium]